MAVARASVTDIDLKAWPSARPGHLLRSCKACPLAADMTVP